jgi:hypothetical protein
VQELQVLTSLFVNIDSMLICLSRNRRVTSDETGAVCLKCQYSGVIFDYCELSDWEISEDELSSLSDSEGFTENLSRFGQEEDEDEGLIYLDRNYVLNPKYKKRMVSVAADERGPDKIRAINPNVTEERITDDVRDKCGFDQHNSATMDGRTSLLELSGCDLEGLNEESKEIALGALDGLFPALRPTEASSLISLCKELQGVCSKSDQGSSRHLSSLCGKLEHFEAVLERLEDRLILNNSKLIIDYGSLKNTLNDSKTLLGRLPRLAKAPRQSREQEQAMVEYMLLAIRELETFCKMVEWSAETQEKSTIALAQSGQSIWPTRSPLSTDGLNTEQKMRMHGNTKPPKDLENSRVINKKSLAAGYSQEFQDPKITLSRPLSISTPNLRGPDGEDTQVKIDQFLCAPRHWVQRPPAIRFNGASLAKNTRSLMAFILSHRILV